MKIDSKYSKKLLAEIESAHDHIHYSIPKENSKIDKKAYHLQYLLDKNYVRGSSTKNGGVIEYFISDLSPSGHEYLLSVDIPKKFIQYISNNIGKIIIGVIITVLGGIIIINYDSITDDYLIKNRAQLIPILFIDSFTNDSVYYHIEIENINPIAAKNISYRLTVNEISQSENKNIHTELGNNEKFSIYLISPSATNDNPFSLDLFLYYNSIWDNDTLNHNEKFVFFIPRNNLQQGMISPHSKQLNNLLPKSQLDSITLINKLKEKDGILIFGFFEYEVSDSIMHFTPPDSTFALVYRSNQKDIIFQKLFPNGELLTIQHLLKPKNNKSHVVILKWVGEYYTLHVDGDTAQNIDLRKLE